MEIKKLADDLGLTPEEFMELLEIYVKKSNSDMKELKKAIDSGNLKDVAVFAHSLKGASLNMGFEALAENALGIEAKAKKGVWDGIEEHYAVLIKGYESLNDEYNNLKK